MADTPTAARPPGAPGASVAGLVCGIIALVLSLTIILSIVGLLLAVAGIVLSWIGIRQGNQRGVSNGMAIAGLVCSLIALVLGGMIVACVASI